MKLTNKLGLPQALVEAIRNDPYPHGKTGDISVTALIDSPQVRRLRREREIEEDVSDRIWALLGQSVHTILERSGIGINEKRYFRVMDGVEISGQIDHFYKGILQDWKITSVWSVINPKASWERQLNVLYWLAALDIKKLQIVAILRDWSKHKARENNYPNNQVEVIDIPIWSREKVEDYIRERLRVHREVQTCSSEDMWERPTKWAVMRKGRKSAIRLLDTEEEALERAEKEKGYVEKRPGERVRCESYCNVREFCPQYGKQNMQNM